MPAPHQPTRVVIAGGGIAAVELALALHDLAGDRVALTMIAPDPDFELRPLRTAEPFARDHVRRHALKDLAAQLGAELVEARLESVDAAAREVRAGDRAIGYDELVVAVGGRHVTALEHALTFTGDRRSFDYNGLLADIDEGYAHTVSFVVPPGMTWPLPLYELALMTAGEAWSAGIDGIRLQIVTPEATPLALFGPQATAAMTELLERAGIAFRGSTHLRETAEHRLEVVPGGEPFESQRVVALPTIEGIRIDGLPADDHGFLPVDGQFRVVGLDGVSAAGDGTTFPVKQGGIACQQADAIAERLAAAAGAPVDPQPFRPVLRGRVMAGRGAQYLEHALAGGDGEGPAPELQLWSIAQKVDGRYLSPWLAAQEGAAPATAADGAEAGDIEVEVTLPSGG